MLLLPACKKNISVWAFEQKRVVQYRLYSSIEMYMTYKYRDAYIICWLLLFKPLEVIVFVM